MVILCTLPACGCSWTILVQEAQSYVDCRRLDEKVLVFESFKTKNIIPKTLQNVPFKNVPLSSQKVYNYLHTTFKEPGWLEPPTHQAMPNPAVQATAGELSAGRCFRHKRSSKWPKPSLRSETPELVLGFLGIFWGGEGWVKSGSKGRGGGLGRVLGGGFGFGWVVLVLIEVFYVPFLQVFGCLGFVKLFILVVKT